MFSANFLEFSYGFFHEFFQGWLEVIVDRRASYDDARGMGEGILDNRDTEHRYWLLLEPMKKPLINSNSNPEAIDEVSVPSALANHMSRRLDHSPIQFICSGKENMPLKNRIASP